MAYSSHYVKAYLNQCHSFFKRLFRSKIKILRNVSSSRYSLFFSYVFGQYVAQLFLLHTMCEIFRHFFLSLDCATAQMKLNFWLSLSGKQGQNPCFRPPAVYQDLSIAPWLACYISHRQIANQVKRKIWNIFLFMGHHPSLINTSPDYEELHFAAMGFEPVRNREIFWI